MSKFMLHKFVMTADLIAIVASACTGSGSGASAPGGIGVSFVTPTDGADVSIPFNVQVQATVPLGSPDTGMHHVHLYFDTPTATTDESTYDKLYSASFTVTRALAPGKHTLLLAVANADHSLAGGATQTITVNVTGGSGGSPAPSGVGGSAAPTSGY
jgi:hypothetical protein